MQKFVHQFLDDERRGWQRFHRTLANKIIFSDVDTTQTTEYVGKFHVRRGVHASKSVTAGRSAWLTSQQQKFAPELSGLKRYRERTLELLRFASQHDHHRELVLAQRRNHTAANAAFIQRLLHDPTITIKPADKNLGMVMVETSWYEAELSRMLSDTITYSQFDPSKGIKIGNQHYATKNMEEVQQKLQEVLKYLTRKHATTLCEWFPTHGEQMVRFLSTSFQGSQPSLPAIYLLIKVHKPKGLCGRPIVPATHWVTTPASVVVDHLLQDVMKKASIPWLVKDTKSLVNELERLFIDEGQKDAIFVTADIASLYTNIDTAMGTGLVREFLFLHDIPVSRIQAIMDLLRFVMNSSFLTFKGTVYHQVDGTAMGTPCAPPYANIVVYMLERRVIQGMRASIYVYRRYLDDIWAYIPRSQADAFMQRMNSLHPKLKFDFVTHPTEATFLDLQITKGTRFYSQGLFDLRVHQKSMNMYLYIPYRSFHPDAAKRSFIQTELMRYIRNSSDREEYIKVKRLFYERLRDRGYPHKFLLPIFEGIFYEDRPYFLMPASELAAGVARMQAGSPPRSVTLLRRLARQKYTSSASHRPPAFIIPYSPLSRILPTRSILRSNWQLVQEATGMPPPIIAYEGQPSILTMLVYGKARREREKEDATQESITPLRNSESSSMQA
jgi:hypothetical protein